MKQGLAQRLFEERERRSIVEKQTPSAKKQAWPLLDTLCLQECLPSIDLFFTTQLLQNLSDIPEAVACFICHLSLASRQGHLCIRMHENRVEPNPIEVWRVPEDLPRQEETLNRLTALICEGARLLPEALFTNTEMNSDTPLTPLCKQDNRYYLQKFWMYETQFLNLFQTLQQTKPALSFDISAIQENIKKLEQEKKLVPEQAEAVIRACKNCLTLVCGGPGTGKTYTAAYIIQTLWQGLSPEQKEHFEILLAAPTGKAAAQLQKSLTKVLDSLQGMKPVTAKTLHAVLGITKQIKTSQKNISYLSADLILVDESSMIDVKLMIELLKSVKPAARLILLGDPYQLPPVESGGMFSDIISTLDTLSDSSLKPISLKTCLRSELKGILSLAEGVKSGNARGPFFAS
jgi:exodeoxyribonuclease V alpha subunit